MVLLPCGVSLNHVFIRHAKASNGRDEEHAFFMPVGKAVNHGHEELHNAPATITTCLR